MKILIVSATTFEIAPLFQHLDRYAEKLSFFDYQLQGNVITPLVTGVGALNTAFGMARYKDMEAVDVAINVGLAGSYTKSLTPGTVVEVVKDRFADLGVEEKDGRFTDVFELELTDKNQFPFQNGWMENNKPKMTSTVPKVASLTVNKVHGTAQSIDAIMKKYNAETETMEGAGFLYACKIMDVHNHQYRAISNYVEPRNRDNWKIDLAIDRLNQHLIHTLQSTAV